MESELYKRGREVDAVVFSYDLGGEGEEKAFSAELK